MYILESLWFKRAVASLITLVIALVIYAIIKGAISKIFKLKVKGVSTKKQKTLQIFFTNIAKWIVVIIAFMIILEICGIDTGVIITSLGAVTVVIGLAFQDILKDFIAGVSFIFENSYNVGDIVAINGFKGEVIYMGMKATKIKALSGEIFIINNGSIKEITNYTMANSIVLVDVGVSYESDIEKVEKVLTKLSEKLSKELPYLKGDVKVLGVEDLGSSAVVFRLSAEVEQNMIYKVQRDLRKQIKLELDKNNISIPYNQLVIHNG